jgi:hypothetical protein
MNGVQKPFAQLDPSLKVAQCPCTNQLYKLILKPILRNGSAELHSLVCANCGHVVDFKGDAIVGDRDKVYSDNSGRKHYYMDVTVGKFGKS